MAINNNSKKARVARACHAAAQRKNLTAPVAFNPPAQHSTRRSCHTIPESSDESPSEGPKEFSHHQSHPPTPEPKGPNPVMPDVETLRATRNALHAQVILAARQGEKSAEV